jgi:processive 1,2-diacylglycerol beta-glucosyltransferase
VERARAGGSLRRRAVARRAALPPRILIFTASVGEGHDLPARVLADELRSTAPGAETTIVDSLPVLGGTLERVAERGLRQTLAAGRLHRAFDLEYLVFARFAPMRRLGQALLHRVSGARVAAFVARQAPDVVVSTYPVATDVLGALRSRRRIAAPVVAAVTDLSSLWYWAHPGADLHLLTHPESVAEVKRLAPRSRIEPVRGLNDPRFLAPPAPAEARRALGLPDAEPVVAVSGGGWAVGDLAGAVHVARAVGATTLVLAGRNARVLARLDGAFAADDGVRVLGFVDDMATLFSAADVLIHSTAGLTILEALMTGCRAISYGWGQGHIRLNNRAFERYGMAEVATTPEALVRALDRALAGPRVPRYVEFAALPSAAAIVLELAVTLGGRARRLTISPAARPTAT